MKKYFIFLFMCLLSPLSIHCMELVPKKYNAKCERVARYFLRQIAIDKMTLSQAFDTFPKLEKHVQKLICNGSVAQQSPFIMLLAVPQDIFTHIAYTILPCYEKKQKVEFSGSGYGRYNDKGYVEAGGIPHVLMPGNNNISNATENSATELVATDKQMPKIVELPVVVALTVLTRYIHRQSFQIKDDRELDINRSSCASDFDFTDYMHKTYSFTLDDFITVNAEQEQLLMQIAQKHSEGLHSTGKRHILTQKDRALLLPIKDIINNNVLFRTLNINIDCPPKSSYEKFKDKIIFGIPLSFVSCALPEIMHHVITGKLQWCGGMVAVPLVGFVCGQWIYPVFDSFDSGSIRLQQWFGSDNKTKIRRGESFAALSAMHYVLTSLAHQCLQASLMPLQIMGYLIHGIRASAFICGLFNVRSYFRKSLFADVFQLEHYQNFMKRRNRDGKSFNLGDAINSP